ncbi:MAG: cysteine-rich CWC family protein [Bacteroidia bacterium]|nr:cysteine-rich CWC family protein [Bacteroidia bacterium]
MAARFYKINFIFLKTQATIKTCSRCHDLFDCNAENISQCRCHKLMLEKEVIQFVAENFSGCLCIPCLVQLKRTFYISGKKLQPQKSFTL